VLSGSMTGPASTRNNVVAHPTAEFMEFIAKHNISFEDAAAARQRDDGQMPIFHQLHQLTVDIRPPSARRFIEACTTERSPRS
jgi:hypothetical protein